jgi:hypothetical protein
VEIFHYKNNPIKCICTNIEEINFFNIICILFGMNLLRQSWKGGDDILTYGEKGAWGKKV